MADADTARDLPELAEPGTKTNPGGEPLAAPGTGEPASPPAAPSPGGSPDETARDLPPMPERRVTSGEQQFNPSADSSPDLQPAGVEEPSTEPDPRGDPGDDPDRRLRTHELRTTTLPVSEGSETLTPPVEIPNEFSPAPSTEPEGTARGSTSLVVEVGEGRFDTAPDPPRESTRRVDYGDVDQTPPDANAGEASISEVTPAASGSSGDRPSGHPSTRPDRPAATRVRTPASPPLFTLRERRVLLGAIALGGLLMAASYLAGYFG
jgi:hypothetical protein